MNQEGSHAVSRERGGPEGARGEDNKVGEMGDGEEAGRGMCVLSGGLHGHVPVADVPVRATWRLTVVSPPNGLVVVSLWSL